MLNWPRCGGPATSVRLRHEVLHLIHSHTSAVLRVVSLIAAIAALTLLIGIRAAQAAVPSTLLFNHDGTACRSNPGTHNLPSGMSETGVAFDGSRLLISCWGDTTITAVNPANGSELLVYTVTGNGAKAFGALAYDRASGTLWACASYSTDQKTERNSREVGTITLDANGTGTYTPRFTTPGCINGLAFDTGTTSQRAGTLWTSANIATKVYNWTTSGTQREVHDISSTSAVAVGFNSGIAVGGGNLYLANPQTTTKRVFRVDPAFSAPGVSVLQSSHRYEDMECDDVTYGSQAVVWVQWFNQNVLKPLPIAGGCGFALPPTLALSQDPAGPVTADSNLTFTLHVSNLGSATQTGVTLADTPPAESIFVSAVPSQGTCSGSTSITCPLGSLPGGGSATVQVTVQPIQPGTVSNQGSVASDQAAQVSSLQAATVNAEPGVFYITLNDTAFTPGAGTLALGGIVQFNAFGASTHEVVDTVRLLDTGVLTPTAFARHEFDAAGNYLLTDSPSGRTGTVNLTPACPATGTVGIPMTVTWASQPLPAGYDEDVQVLYPGTTGWVTWAPNQTGTSGQFTPNNGSGTYKFRARLQLTGTSQATLYSSARLVSVS
jgi:uncharacterized repeat protein (TIGR01451 family)